MEVEDPVPQTPQKTITRASSSKKVDSVSLTPKSQQRLARTLHGYNTKAYYKFLYQQTQHAHKKIEKSLNLEEIPGLLTINKVKPKDLQKKSSRITNVHSSMEGQDILFKVESIEAEKQKKN